MTNSRLNNEKALLDQVAAGDEQAFAELFYAYYQHLGVYVLGWTKSASVAEEIVQDVFIKIWTGREKLAEVESFERYLFVLSRNHTFNALRQTARDRIRQKEWLRYLDQSQEVTQETLPDDYLQLIDQAIAKLPPQQQKVFILKRQQGLKYDDIAARLLISPETARKHHSAAMNHIRAYIQSHINITFLVLSTPLLLSEIIF